MSKANKNSLEVRIANNSVCYPIIIGKDCVKQFAGMVTKQSVSRVAIITDTTVSQCLNHEISDYIRSQKIPTEIFTFPAGEKNKNQKIVTKLQHQLLAKKYGRDTLIVAFGGGVVGDVAGYVAATFLRGVPYLQIPTTLLAMVDSSVGGKVGIDSPYGKNTVGAFFQPRGVIMDIAFLKKLSEKQFNNGLFEALKTFFTSDKIGLSLCKKIVPGKPVSEKLIKEIIYRSVKIKSRVIMRDQFETNERRILNFGHTIGHAMEKLSNYTLPHGYAVAIGMLAESRLAEKLGILKRVDCEYLFSFLGRFDVTTKIFTKYSATEILTLTKGDKKTVAGKPRYVLLKKLGAVDTRDGQFAHPAEDGVALQVLKEFGCK